MLHQNTMLRFFEQEAQRTQSTPAAPSEIKLSQLLKFARASRMQKDILFPSVPPSSLLNGYAENNEQRTHGCNGTADLFNSRYSGSFVTYGNGDSSQLQGFSQTYKGTSTPTEAFAATPIKIPSGSSDPSMAATSGNLQIPNSIHGHPTAIVETRKNSSITDLIREGATSKHDSKRQKTSHNYSEKPFLTPSDKSSAIPTQQINQATVRKSQKLGDKVTALQQLVSPFGKTDTASVLHEAAIYIKVLHEQIQVLASPYFRCSFHTSSQSQEAERVSLNSRGLCLVPTSKTFFDFAEQHHTQHCEPERIAWRLGRQPPLR